jgi:M6 family metalloprotease-like protein
MRIRKPCFLTVATLGVALCLGAISSPGCGDDAPRDAASHPDDKCPAVPGDDLADADQDGLGDTCDNCPFVANADQGDVNQNAFGDACEPGFYRFSYDETVRQGAQIEAGPRNLLVIVIHTGKVGGVLISKEKVLAALYGPHGVVDYFNEIGDHRVSLVDVGALGPYSLERPYDSYFPDIPCGAPDSRGFVTGGREIWMEALLDADREFDFEPYDSDADGVLTERELAILFINDDPAEGNRGVNRPLVNCPGSALGQRVTLDGVRLEMNAASWSPVIKTSADFAVGAHELAHLLWGLPDMYVGGTTVPNTPGRFCLMAVSGGAVAPHPEAVFKLALGWATPRLLTAAGHYELEDVKTSHQVAVLPRSNGALEYFLLENRQESASNATTFDTGIGDSGIAIWHVISPLHPDAKALGENPPACSETQWTADTWKSGERDLPRRSIRLIRPSASLDKGTSLWKGTADTSPDTSAARCGDAEVLAWADGTPSEYVLKNFSVTGAVMSFDLELR